PAVLTDRENRPMAWYLPELVPPCIQECLLDSLEDLPSVKSSNTRRNKPEAFRMISGDRLTPRALDVTPAWYSLGHVGRQFPLYASKSLSAQSPSSVPVIQWFSKHLDILAVLCGVIQIIHPEQYSRGLETLLGLISNPQLLSNPEYIIPLLNEWCLPFTGIAILVNRQSEVHRDRDAPLMGFDICTTMGFYLAGWFNLPDLKTSLAYPPGAAVFLLAKTFNHEVPHVDGERAAIILFNKDPIQEALRLPSIPSAPRIL
ncbi:hypothetical protein BDN72DRAFT_780138, partial [Pluteus cervinus]